MIECSAADGVPAANMSWLLPEGVSEASWFNFSSHNGSHTVKGVLLLLDCLPWERTATCVINHPAFEEAEHRSVNLPVCGAFPESGSRTFCLAAEFSSLPPHSLCFNSPLSHSSPEHHRRLSHRVGKRRGIHRGGVLCAQRRSRSSHKMARWKQRQKHQQPIAARNPG